MMLSWKQYYGVLRSINPLLPMDFSIFQDLLVVGGSNSLNPGEGLMILLSFHGH